MAENPVFKALAEVEPDLVARIHAAGSVWRVLRSASLSEKVAYYKACSLVAPRQYGMDAGAALGCLDCWLKSLDDGEGPLGRCPHRAL
jgi:hypothetical protein